MNPAAYARLIGQTPPLAPATPDQLRAYRAQHGLTQQALADILGKTLRSIRFYESDPAKPLPGPEWLLLRLLGNEITPAKAREEVTYPTQQRRPRSQK